MFELRWFGVALVLYAELFKNWNVGRAGLPLMPRHNTSETPLEC